MRRLTLSILFAPMLWLVAATAGAAAPRATLAKVTITGPIAVTAESGDAYRGSNEQPTAGPGLPPPMLAPYNYVQEEYFIAGTVDGKSYLTTLLVRKPKDASKFSGLVGVETIHAAGAIPFWGSGREVWMPGGHAWIAVASQRVALEAQVRKFNPKRYASLSVPEATAPAGARPEGGMSGGPQDLLSQQIMTQVGQMLKGNRKDGPLAGLQVKYLLMGGSSQTGGTTLRYIQQSHAGARMPNGKPVYDGYLPMEAFSSGPLSGGDAAVIHAVGEGDFGLFTAFPGAPPIEAARDDSDAPNDRYREYQFPGASHVPTRGSTKSGGPNLVDSQFPTAPLYKGAMLNLIAWVTQGVAPPQAPRLERVNGAIARDEHGNAKGGIRTPYVDVPTARYIASPAVAPGGDRMRAMMGLQEPFPAEKLRALYQTRENYLQLFNAGIDRLVAGRWITADDGAKLKQEEAALPLFADAATGISADALLARANSAPRSLLILDVRTPEEYATGHVPGAINIPQDRLTDRLGELAASRDQDIVLYCRSGRRAGLAATTLRANGFRQLLHLEGDMQQWIDERRPIAQ